MDGISSVISDVPSYIMVHVLFLLYAIFMTDENDRARNTKQDIRVYYVYGRYGHIRKPREENETHCNNNKNECYAPKHCPYHA